MPRSPRIQSQTPIDHDMIVSKDGVIYVVVGNNHPQDFIYAYPKYKPVNKLTPWCNIITCYERIPSYYEALHIYNKSINLVEEYNDPKYSTKIIGLKRNNITKILSAKKRLWEIISSPKTQLEILLLDLIDNIISIGIHTESLGITGSLLAKIHNDKLSDIDLVVYGIDNAIKMVESWNNILKPLKGKHLEEWIINHSKAYNLPPSIVSKYYAGWRRGLFKNRIVSLIYVNPNDIEHKYPSKIYRYQGPVRITAYVEPKQSTSIIYPAKVQAKVVEVHRGPTSIKGLEVTILSYEALYSKPLYLGGKLLVEGALYFEVDNGGYEILVGVKEHRGFIIANT